VLHAAGIPTRLGMRRGTTLVRGNPLTDRLDMEGDSVNFAARLEPLAEQGEVLITVELRYHPEVEPDHFVFIRHQRILKKDVGDQQQGDVVACYSPFAQSISTILNFKQPMCAFSHIPSDLVVDRWASDGEGSSRLDLRFLHDISTTFGRWIIEKVPQQYQ
jgi:hypothetical protein